MTDVPLVSIIIPTLNEEKYLPILLASLQKIAAPLEIIVVDGGSTDHTATVAEVMKGSCKYGTTFQFIALNKRGIALQRNVGASYATSELLLFCDADIVAPTTAEHQLLIYAFIKNNYVVATSLMVPIEKTLMTCAVHITGYYVQKLLAYTGRPFFGGAYLLTTKAVFTKVGGFDETLRVSEDVDYSLRAAEQGAFKIFTVPIKVSTRRFQKYGYGWVVKNPATIIRLIRKGKITNEQKIFYPFGEY